MTFNTVSSSSLLFMFFSGLPYILHGGNVIPKGAKENTKTAETMITREQEIKKLTDDFSKYSQALISTEQKEPLHVQRCKKEIAELSLSHISVFANQQKVQDMKSLLLREFNTECTDYASRIELIQAIRNCFALNRRIYEQERTIDGKEIQINSECARGITLFLMAEELKNLNDKELKEALLVRQSKIQAEFEELEKKEELLNEIHKLKTLLTLLSEK